MAMVIPISFLGLEGQTSSSLEEDGIGHGWPPSELSTEERREVAMVILLFRSRKGRPPLH